MAVYAAGNTVGPALAAAGAGITGLGGVFAVGAALSVITAVIFPNRRRRMRYIDSERSDF